MQLLARCGEGPGVGNRADDLELAEIHASGYICRPHRFNRIDYAAPSIVARVRSIASSRYRGSISIPTKLMPSCAHATAVDPRPRKGSATTRSRSRPCSRKHISGSLGGKVAGCGRSFSRFWMVSYGMNHVLPRQRTPDAPDRQRLTLD